MRKSDDYHELKVAYCKLTVAKSMKDVEVVRERIGEWLSTNAPEKRKDSFFIQCAKSVLKNVPQLRKAK